MLLQEALVGELLYETPVGLVRVRDTPDGVFIKETPVVVLL